MSAPIVLNPSDLGQERLKAIYNREGLETKVDDGDLIVTDGVSCYAIPTQERDRILLLTFVRVRDEVEPHEKLEFVNRVNNEISTIRARVNPKGRVLFDYHIPVDGGITERAIVLATQFFLNAVAYLDSATLAPIVTRSVSEGLGYSKSLAYASGYDVEQLTTKVALSNYAASNCDQRHIVR